MTLRVGEDKAIQPSLSPIGFLGEYSYQIDASSPADLVEIRDGTIHAKGVGEVLIHASATNKEGAKYPFALSDDFTVTVTRPPREEGEILDNGGFEYDFYRYQVVSANPDLVYSTSVVGASPHSGECALNLWSETASGASDYLNLTLTQVAEIPEAGHYLYSLWFKGDIDSLTLSISHNGSLVKEELFDATKYLKLVDEDQNGYAQYGIDFGAEAGEYSFAFHATAEKNANWGFIDDVSVRLGSVGDLVRPENVGDDEHNFIPNPSMAANLDHVVTLTEGFSRATTNGTFLSYYGATGGTVEFYEVAEELPELDNYVASMKVIASGEYTALTSECYFYVASEDGTILYREDFALPGYEWKRIALRDLSLSGNVRFGVAIVSSTRIWCGFTELRIYSPGYVYEYSDDASLESLSVCGVEASKTEEGFSVTLDEIAINTLVTVADDCRSNIEATVAKGATVQSATYNADTKLLSITVLAEDGSKAMTYFTQVYGKGEIKEYEAMELTNPSFEDHMTGFQTENLSSEGLTNSGKPHSGSANFSAYGAILDIEQYARVFQKIAGLQVGDSIRFSVYVSTYYHSLGAKTDVIASLRLFAGSQAKEMDHISTTSSSYYLYQAEFTLTAADFDNGEVRIGFEFLSANANPGLYADDVSFEKAVNS